jgi:acyl carrier protein
MSESFEEVKQILAHALQLGERANAFDRSTPLLGSLPEFDSMAVVTLVTAMEEHFGFMVDDDEISAETFETLGSLADFVDQKQSS